MNASSAEACDWRQFQVLAPRRGAFSGFDVNQGFRSLHSLNPWLLSVHASGVPYLVDGSCTGAIVFGGA